MSLRRAFIALRGGGWHWFRAASKETHFEGFRCWRFEQLLRAGYEEEDATEIAFHLDIDLHYAIELVRRGCPSATAGSLPRCPGRPLVTIHKQLPRPRRVGAVVEGFLTLGGAAVVAADVLRPP
jgi:hypothetical protein